MGKNPVSPDENFLEQAVQGHDIESNMGQQKKVNNRIDELHSNHIVVFDERASKNQNAHPKGAAEKTGARHQSQNYRDANQELDEGSTPGKNTDGFRRKRRRGKHFKRTFNKGRYVPNASD